MRGGKGSTISRAPIHYGGAESLREPPKSPNKVTSTFFNTVNLLSKELRFEHGDRTVARKFSVGGLCVSAGGIWACARGLDILKLTKSQQLNRVS